MHQTLTPTQKAEFSIEKLSLHFFRSYQSLRLDVGSKFIVLTGDNGAGKTNILEALSLLSPGRGLRGAKLSEMQNIHHPAPLWAVAADTRTAYGPVALGTGFARDNRGDGEWGEKRLLKINGDTGASQQDLGEMSAVLWLTPQMEKLFVDSASGRRRFLDRFVFTFDPKHTGRLTRYENAMRQRSKLLKEGRADPTWIVSLEKIMAESAVAITAARLDLCRRLNQSFDRLSPLRTSFPPLDVTSTGWIETALMTYSAVDSEDLFLKKLFENRTLDAQTGGATDGPHKSDMNVTHREKTMPAAQCSTGEQKSMLVSLILGQSSLLQAERGFAPLLLLDDIVSHFDDKRRGNLFDFLVHLDSQCWMTGTDKKAFAPIAKISDHRHVHDSCVSS